MLTDLLSNYLPANSKYAEAKIIKMVKDAYDNVPFYKDLLDSHRLNPSNFNVISDYVEKFPRTTTKEYRRIKKERGDSYVMDKRYLNVEIKKLLSGGSSGTPVNILRTNTEYERIHGAATVYSFIRAGVRPWHKIMAMLPPWDVTNRQHSLQKIGIFRRYDASFVEDAGTILDRIIEKGVNVMFGRVSMMRMLAEHCIQSGRKVPPMEVILPGAEVVSPDSRRLLLQVFNPRLYREIYGSTETGIIAMKMGNGDYEVNFRNVFFSLTNPTFDNGIATGEIAVTSLHAIAAPILMMELGDVVSCRGYEQHLDLNTSIVNIAGRVSDFVLSESGEKISASVFYSLLTNEPIVRQFRIIQEEIGKCEIMLLLADCSHNEITKLEEKILVHFDKIIKTSFKYVDNIPFDKNGKTRVVVNRIVSS